MRLLSQEVLFPSWHRVLLFVPRMRSRQKELTVDAKPFTSGSVILFRSGGEGLNDGRFWGMSSRPSPLCYFKGYLLAEWNGREDIYIYILVYYIEKRTHEIDV